MPTLTVIISGDAAKLQKEMEKIKELAKKTGRDIKVNLNAGAGPEGHFKAGAMREAMVMVRELARGDMKRFSSSATIFAQQMGLVKYALNPVVGIVAGLVAGIAAGYKLTTLLIDKLTGLKMPDWNPQYIAKHLQRQGQVAEAQREINEQVEKSARLYNSAANQAERLADVTKEHYQHMRKMYELQEEMELKQARSEREKSNIRTKYAITGLNLNEQERAEMIRQAEAKQRAMADEAEKKRLEAASILTSMPSAAADQQNLKRLQEAAAGAQKLKSEDLANRGGGLIFKEHAGREAVDVATLGLNHAALLKAEKDRKEELDRRISAANEFEDQVHGRDIRRKRAEELNKEAGTTAADAAKLALEIQNQKGRNRQKSIEEKQEATAKLDAENAHKNKMMHGHVNALQQVGAYAAPATLVDVGKKQLHKLGEIHSALVKNGAMTSTYRALGGTQY